MILGNFKRSVCHYERTIIKALLVEGIHLTVELFLIGLFWLRTCSPKRRLNIAEMGTLMDLPSAWKNNL